MIKYLALFCSILIFTSVGFAHEQSTSVPEIDVEGGETFEPNSDELGSIDEVELSLRHDGINPPWNSEIEVDGEQFNVVDETADTNDDATIVAESDQAIELFDGEVDLSVDTSDELLLTNIVLKGDRRFQNIEYAEETDTGIAETLDPELQVAVDHPENQLMDFTFYDIEDESELGETYRFTTCGREGSIGPDQGDCDDNYEATSLEDDVSVVQNSGIQEWEVPFTGRYDVTAVGAQGGGDHGGLGAEITIDVMLEEGDVLRIASGQQGDLFDDTFTSGSGGSFVTRVVNDGYEMFDGTDVEPILIAGGGAGATQPNQNQDANLGEGGRDGEFGGNTHGNTGSGSGGNNGDGGNEGGAEGAGSGAGLLGGGSGNGRISSGDELSRSFVQNPPLTGGQEYSDGGFGGGGASIADVYDRAGGGGGYSGGGSATGQDWAAGGGGGSYVTDDDRYDAEIIEEEVSSTGQGFVELEIEGSPDRVIGTESGVEPGELTELEWSDRENFEDYSWTVEVCETGSDNCVLSTSIWDFTVEVNYPDVEMRYDNYNSEHGFDAIADIEFGRDEGEYNEECYFNFTNGEEDYHYLEGEFNSLGTRDGTCETEVYPESNEDRFDSDDEYDGLFEGFEVWDTIDVTVNVTDHGIGYTVVDDSNPIRNQDPIATLNTPDDGGLELEDDVDLSIQANNPEGDNIDVEFRKSVSDELLYSNTYADGSTVSTIWDDRDLGTHEWYAILKDPYNESESTVWEFNRVVSASYRPRTSMEYEYSSLVVSEDETGFLFFNINNDQATRDFTTYVDGEGIEPYFVEEEASTKSYELESGDSNRMHIGVEGLEPGEHELEIITKDEDLDVNTTQTFPVFVQSTEAESRGVSGLTIYYIGLIYLLAISYFWFSA